MPGMKVPLIPLRKSLGWTWQLIWLTAELTCYAHCVASPSQSHVIRGRVYYILYKDSPNGICRILYWDLLTILMFSRV